MRPALETWGRKGRNTRPVVIQTATTNTSVAAGYPDTSGFHPTLSPDGINSEENHLEVPELPTIPPSLDVSASPSEKHRGTQGETCWLKLSLLGHLFWVYPEDVGRKRRSDVFISTTGIPE